MNLREYGREGNLETSAPSLTGIFYMQGEEYSMKKSGVLGLAVLLALADQDKDIAGCETTKGNPAICYRRQVNPRFLPQCLGYTLVPRSLLMNKN